MKLHRLLARGDENVFFCPFSLSSALSMLLYGVRGEAATEMRKVLGFENIDNDAIACIFQNFISTFEKMDDYAISYGNALAIRKDFIIKEQYISAIEKYFKADCFQVDFANDSTAAVNRINNWIKEKTQNMITSLLDSLDSQTMMVILNAIYFKGFWMNHFQEKSTFMQYFYNDGEEDNAKLVEMMHLKESFLFTETENFKALKLPYKEDIAMLILLPNARDGLKDLENQITSNFISENKKQMAKEKVEVALPKFRLDYSKNLKEYFNELGMKQIFKCGADYSGFNDSKNLVVSQILHKAVLEVNEQGCEAAAATAVVTTYRAMTFTQEFIVDHPFLFVIYNTSNDLILFMGRVKEL